MLIFFTITMPRAKKPENHSHDFHEFYYCLEGKGCQYTDSHSFKTSEGELYFFPAGQKHSGSARDKTRHIGQVLYLPVNFFSSTKQGDSCIFETVRSLENKALNGENLIELPASVRHTIRETFLDLTKESELRTTGYEAAQRHLTGRLLLLILRHSTLPAESQEHTPGREAAGRISRLCSFLDSNFHQSVSVNRAASITGLSRSHFHAAFRSATGKTLVEYINDLRIDNVIQLLQNTSMPSSEIAKTCGFTSLSHMYYVVRQKTGRNPRTIRNPHPTSYSRY